MRPAYGMGRRSFSRPGALRFTAAPCSRLAKRRAIQQGGRPAIHSGAAPPHGSRRPAAQPHLTTTPDDRRRSPRSTRQAADSPTARRKPASQQPPTTGHEMAGKPARQPPAGPPRPAVPLHNPPGRRPSAPSCINPPELPRPAIHSGAAPLHNNPRRPAAQPPLHGHPATGHEMAGKPTWQSPAGPPSPAPSCIIPRNRRAPPSPCITRRATSARRPLPSGKREPRPQRAPLRMPDRYIRSVAGPPGARRFAAEGGGGPPKIYFFSSPNTP